MVLATGRQSVTPAPVSLQEILCPTEPVVVDEQAGARTPSGIAATSASESKRDQRGRDMFDNSSVDTPCERRTSGPSRSNLVIVRAICELGRVRRWT
jgi:hypothetical protein